ncbi:hypothetical protein I79_011322 [Cricetulus griseus]|uniref:Uncharacterized protein n=1 Tax=Cricetulus griseus TaxID=10029 RepID=G3HKU2_CRIGR|nr:hypothetical protein I79_011322 [Cricetulus griseus]
MLLLLGDMDDSGFSSRVEVFHTGVKGSTTKKCDRSFATQSLTTISNVKSMAR